MASAGDRSASPSPFTIEAVEGLGGPAWLRDRRRKAFGRYEAMSWPSAVEEVWRYSRIAALDLDAFRPAPPGQLDSPSSDAIASVDQRAALIVTRNGYVTNVEIAPDVAATGVKVGRAIDIWRGDETSGLGAVAGPATSAFDELHDAFMADPVVVRVPAGVTVTNPILVLHVTDLDGIASFPRLVVEAGPDSDFTVYEHQDSDDVLALVMPVTELSVGPASRLRYLNAQTLGQRVWQLGRQASHVGRDANLLTAMVALGGDYARLRIDSTMVGKGGSGEMLAVYFGEGKQLHDFRTVQDHIAPATTSRLLFKGAVGDQARSVYTGLIHIGKEGAGVNAFQTNRNIKLSKEAWAESVPNLEIENNDVHCSHASAVGPVDLDQMFYLESRGVPPKVAERLIVSGFFEEVLERLPVPGAVGPLRAEIAAKLERREAGGRG